MLLRDQLLARAGSKCELCVSQSDLAVYDVKPNGGASVDNNVLLCARCRDAVDQPQSVDVKHWYSLRDSMWSEHDAVKVLSYRVLKGLGGHALAQELLSQIYLDDSLQTWADAGLGAANAGDSEGTAAVDSNGTPLSEGDSVTLIKDLEVKGANFTAKRGTMVKGIALTDDPKFVEGKVNGIRIVLVAAYLKKA